MTTEATTLPLWRTLAETDPEIAQAIRDELHRQNDGLELIASENSSAAPSSKPPARC
jgi:glycine/serine hydroxymethyltransferase